MAKKRKARKDGIPCVYCGIKQSQNYRHLERIHKDEPAIAEILSQSETLEGEARAKYRRGEYRLLSLYGSAKYNEEVRRRGGHRRSLILARALPDGEQPRPSLRFLECPECTGTYKDIRRHRCEQARKKARQSAGANETTETTENSRDRTQNAKIHTTMITLGTSNRDLAELFSSMKQDEITEAASHDDLAIQYINFGLLKIIDYESDYDSDEDYIDPTLSHPVGRKKKESKRDTLRAEIRYLGRYILAFRKKFPAITVADTFTAQYIHYVHRVIRKLTDIYRQLAQARKLMALLNKLFLFAKSRLETPDFQLVKRIAMQQQIDIVNSHLGPASSVREIVNPLVLPTRSDLLLFRRCLDDKITKFLKMNEEDFNYHRYLDFSRHVICRVVMHNLRRSGEIATIAHEQFDKREAPTDDDLPTVDLMSPEQLDYATKSRVVVLSGKGSGTKHQTAVAVLRREWVQAMKKIQTLGYRFLGGKDNGNQYLFGTAGALKMWQRGNKAFEFLTKKYKVRNVTAGKIRMFAATNCAFEGDIRKKRLLSSILSHDFSTHCQIYEAHMATGTAKFWHVPAMLNYVENGDGDLQNVTLTLPEVPEGSAKEPEIDAAQAEAEAEADAESEGEPEAEPEATAEAQPAVRQGRLEAKSKKSKSRGSSSQPATGRRCKVANADTSRAEPWDDAMLAILAAGFEDELQAGGTITTLTSKKVQAELAAKGYSVSVGAVRCRAQRYKKGRRDV